jgi:beta-N-acetylhexosaminidase
MPSADAARHRRSFRRARRGTSPRRWTLARAVLATGAVVVVLASGTGKQADPGSPPSAVAAATSRPTAAPAASQPAPAASCAATTLARMPPRTRIGQLFLLGISADGSGQPGPAITASAPAGVFLTGRATAGVAATARMLTTLQDRGRAASGGAGLFTAVDQEGGQAQDLHGPGFSTMPTAAVQGTWTTTRLQAAATTWGRQLHTAGLNVDLAPVTDTLSPALGKANAPIGAYDRAFGTTPDTVATHATAFARGLHDAGIQSVLKHFPGLGRVRGNTDITSGVTDTTTTPTDPDLQPFTTATHATPAWVMVSTAIYTRIDPTRPAAFSPTVLNILRNRVGYSGLVLSDDLGNAAQVASVPAGQRAVEFLTAGGDIVLTAAPATLAPMIDAVQTATRDPHIAALAAAAELRVLDAKQSMGLLTCTSSPP